jgi:hypothetical protein
VPEERTPPGRLAIGAAVAGLVGLLLATFVLTSRGSLDPTSGAAPEPLPTASPEPEPEPEPAPPPEPEPEPEPPPDPDRHDAIEPPTDLPEPSAGPEGDAEPTPTPAPTEEPTSEGDSETALELALADYREACERLNSELAEASLAFPSSTRIALHDTDLVQATISLDLDRPPEDLIDAEEVATGKLLVSCTVEARLEGASRTFDIEGPGIQEPGWQRRSLVTADTVGWSWFVTPKRLGEHRLTLQLRPVLQIDDGGTEPTAQVLTEASIVERPILVQVSDPSLGARVVRSIESITEVLRTLEGLLLALAAVFLAAAAVKTGMWWRERKGQDSPQPPGGDEPEGNPGGVRKNLSPQSHGGAAASSATSVTPTSTPAATEQSTGSVERPRPR